ncbi:MAG: hypothetical protein LAN18_05070 [Acidobacteriia bacterium]|nr:hypothetical protein [Terriglobia bacterium]
MIAETISPSQMRALQTLFSAYARRFLDVSGGDLRAERLSWASQNVGRAVTSFKELHGGEAARLIEMLKLALGQEVKPAWRRPRDRHAALAFGTHGRKNRPVKIEMIATPGDIEEVQQLRKYVGMTEEDFENWLRSRSSPVGQRPDPRLRTMSDCNRVRWALKAMLRRAG